MYQRPLSTSQPTSLHLQYREHELEFARERQLAQQREREHLPAASQQPELSAQESASLRQTSPCEPCTDDNCTNGERAEQGHTSATPAGAREEEAASADLELAEHNVANNASVHSGQICLVEFPSGNEEMPEQAMQSPSEGQQGDVQYIQKLEKEWQSFSQKHISLLAANERGANNEAAIKAVKEKKLKAQRGINVLKLGVAHQKYRQPFLQKLRAKRTAEIAQLKDSNDIHQASKAKLREMMNELKVQCDQLEKAFPADHSLAGGRESGQNSSLGE
ncbi:hypothetical protein WJX73_003906 [Symbiochloris irregularis]|uniref:Uncharacterized protein n=1 Tax=Symbiochloris irregularis TaxID=706552 RepID=A0AAW1NXS9_9CHLO